MSDRREESESPSDEDGSEPGSLQHAESIPVLVDDAETTSAATAVTIPQVIEGYSSLVETAVESVNVEDSKIDLPAETTKPSESLGPPRHSHLPSAAFDPQEGEIASDEAQDESLPAVVEETNVEGQGTHPSNASLSLEPLDPPSDEGQADGDSAANELVQEPLSSQAPGDSITCVTEEPSLKGSGQATSELQRQCLEDSAVEDKDYPAGSSDPLLLESATRSEDVLTEDDDEGDSSEQDPLNVDGGDLQALDEATQPQDPSGSDSEQHSLEQLSRADADPNVGADELPSVYHLIRDDDAPVAEQCPTSDTDVPPVLDESEPFSCVKNLSQDGESLTASEGELPQLGNETQKESPLACFNGQQLASENASKDEEDDPFRSAADLSLSTVELPSLDDGPEVGQSTTIECTLERGSAVGKFPNVDSDEPPVLKAASQAVGAPLVEMNSTTGTIEVPILGDESNCQAPLTENHFEQQSEKHTCATDEEPTSGKVELPSVEREHQSGPSNYFEQYPSWRASQSDRQSTTENVEQQLVLEEVLQSEATLSTEYGEHLMDISHQVVGGILEQSLLEDASKTEDPSKCDESEQRSVDNMSKIGCDPAEAPEAAFTQPALAHPGISSTELLGEQLSSENTTGAHYSPLSRIVKLQAFEKGFDAEMSHSAVAYDQNPLEKVPRCEAGTPAITAEQGSLESATQCVCDPSPVNGIQLCSAEKTDQADAEVSATEIEDHLPMEQEPKREEDLLANIEGEIPAPDIEQHQPPEQSPKPQEDSPANTVAQRSVENLTQSVCDPSPSNERQANSVGNAEVEISATGFELHQHLEKEPQGEEDRPTITAEKHPLENATQRVCDPSPANDSVDDTQKATSEISVTEIEHHQPLEKEHQHKEDSSVNTAKQCSLESGIQNVCNPAPAEELQIGSVMTTHQTEAEIIEIERSQPLEKESQHEDYSPANDDEQLALKNTNESVCADPPSSGGETNTSDNASQLKENGTEYQFEQSPSSNHSVATGNATPQPAHGDLEADYPTSEGSPHLANTNKETVDLVSLATHPTLGSWHPFISDVAESDPTGLNTGLEVSQQSPSESYDVLNQNGNGNDNHQMERTLEAAIEGVGGAINTILSRNLELQDLTPVESTDRGFCQSPCVSFSAIGGNEEAIDKGLYASQPANVCKRDYDQLDEPQNECDQTRSGGQTGEGNRVLVLASHLALKREVLANQQMAYTILDAARIPYEVLDGSDIANQSRRNELFQLSGLRGQYPQFFKLRGRSERNEAQTVTTFAGDWEQFQMANECGTLRRDFGFDELDVASFPSAALGSMNQTQLTTENGQTQLKTENDGIKSYTQGSNPLSVGDGIGTTQQTDSDGDTSLQPCDNKGPETISGISSPSLPVKPVIFPRTFARSSVGDIDVQSKQSTQASLAPQIQQTAVPATECAAEVATVRSYTSPGLPKKAAVGPAAFCNGSGAAFPSPAIDKTSLTDTPRKKAVTIPSAFLRGAIPMDELHSQSKSPPGSSPNGPTRRKLTIPSVFGNDRSRAGSPALASFSHVKEHSTRSSYEPLVSPAKNFRRESGTSVTLSEGQGHVMYTPWEAQSKKKVGIPAAFSSGYTNNSGYSSRNATSRPNNSNVPAPQSGVLPMIGTASIPSQGQTFSGLMGSENVDGKADEKAAPFASATKSTYGGQNRVPGKLSIPKAFFRPTTVKKTNVLSPVPAGKCEFTMICSVTDGKLHGSVDSAGRSGTANQEGGVGDIPLSLKAHTNPSTSQEGNRKKLTIPATFLSGSE